MSSNGSLISVEDIKGRIEAIGKELKFLDDQQYQYGYIAPKMTVAQLSQEYRQLKDVLEVLGGYPLEEIQKELDNRDPLQRTSWRAEGLARYSFEVLGHAEKVLQHQDKELQARVDLGERVIENWENTFKNLSWDEDRAVYRLIRDKDLPYERLEESIRKCLLRMNEDMLKDVCDIGGRRCIRTDAWDDGVDHYVLGNAVSEGGFWYATVNGKISNTFEYDFRPSRYQVEDDWVNEEAEREINRQEELAGGFDVELEAQKGDSEFYKMFYAGERDDEAFELREKTGWNMIWGSDYQGFNGDTWVVFRAVEDLPLWLRSYAQEQIQSVANLLSDAIGRAGSQHGHKVAVELDL